MGQQVWIHSGQIHHLNQVGIAMGGANGMITYSFHLFVFLPAKHQLDD
jgi:hypothetical protein